MAQRSIDRERFGFAGRERVASSLDTLGCLEKPLAISAAE
jgi:hypothetical protein